MMKKFLRKGSAAAALASDDATSLRQQKAAVTQEERRRRKMLRLRKNIIYLFLLTLAILLPATLPVFESAPLREPAEKFTPENSMEPPLYDNLPAEPAEGVDVYSERPRH